MEQWVDCDWIDGYRGALQVSSKARVRRYGYVYKCKGRWGTTHETRKPDKIISHYVERNGYASVAVQINGHRKRFQLHHLVARAFVPGYTPGLCVNHIDGNKTNNMPSNLEWVTLARNTEHAWEVGLVNVRADNHPNRKLSSGQVRIVRKMLKLGASSGEIAVLCGVSTSTIHLIKKGERWSSIT